MAFHCPRCGTSTAVLKTYSSNAIGVARRRECRSSSCGHLFTTDEVVRADVSPAEPIEDEGLDADELFMASIDHN